MIGFDDDKWPIEQIKRDRFKGIRLSSFEHLSPVQPPEGIDRVKELETHPHSRDFIAKLDVASQSLARPIHHLAASISMKFYGQQKIIPVQTSFPTMSPTQNVPDPFNGSTHR